MMWRKILAQAQAPAAQSTGHITAHPAQQVKQVTSQLSMLRSQSCCEEQTEAKSVTLWQSSYDNINASSSTLSEGWPINGMKFACTQGWVASDHPLAGELFRS